MKQVEEAKAFHHSAIISLSLIHNKNYYKYSKSIIRFIETEKKSCAENASKDFRKKNYKAEYDD